MPNRSSIVILLAVALFCAPASSPAAEPRSCVVNRVEGEDARYWVSGTWSPLTAGLAVPVEAKIQTGAETRVRIVCGDGTVVTIGTETELNLEAFVAAEISRRPVAMQLIEGVIGLFVPRADGPSFEVRTPVAIASVRSTNWLIEWQPGGAAAVFVRDGSVAVRRRGGVRFLLHDGEGITITADGEAGDVKKWGDARIAKSTGRLGFDWR